AAGAPGATAPRVQLGHAGVLHLRGPPGWLATEARIRGWREALAAAGLPAPEPVVTSWDAASGCRAAAEVIARPKITAVFVANDRRHSVSWPGSPIAAYGYPTTSPSSDSTTFPKPPTSVHR